jgi:hypothetical protein
LAHADPVRRASALETIKAGDLAVQGPVQLEPEGFVGLAMRMPIYINNVSDPREAFG